MKPNTSNNGERLKLYELCKEKWGILIPYDIIDACIKQGYAKAIDDVDNKIDVFINKFKVKRNQYRMISVAYLKDLKQQVKRLKDD